MRIEHLATESVEEALEAIARVRIHEVVVGQPADAAGHVLRHRRQLLLTPLGERGGELLQRWIG